MMSILKRNALLMAVACSGLFLAQVASAEIKIGVVNFQRLLEEAPQTKTIMQSLENEFAPRRRELLTMQNDLKAKDEKLQKEGAVMSEADRARAEKSLRDGQREFSRKAGEFQDDASARRNEELGKVQKFLVQEIQAYSAAQGYDLVIGEGVFYAKNQLDLTQQVLAQLATKPATLPAAGTAPAKSVKPAAAPK